MVSPSGQTKDLVRKIYLGILSKNLVLKFNLFTEFFLQFKRTFLVPHVKLPFLMHYNRMSEFKIYPSNLRCHKKEKNYRTKFTYIHVNLIFQPFLASGKLRIELKKANRSINTWKVSFVL